MELKLSQNKKGKLSRLWLNESEIDLNKVKIISINADLTDNQKLLTVALNIDTEEPIDDLTLNLLITEPETETGWKNLEILKNKINSMFDAHEGDFNVVQQTKEIN
jgi:hypothetical protein